jgi:biotin transport system substrate-specific component
VAVNIVFSIIFAILMAISANSFFYLPFTPVPVTMQVFTVLLSALFLGKYWAMITQIEYITLGLYGLPVFAGFKSGLSALSGPTGGYIIGFIIGAFTTGYIFDRLKSRQEAASVLRTNKNQILSATFAIFLSCIAGLAVIYLSGFVHLTGFLFNASKNPKINEVMLKAFNLGVAPFILFDFAKIILILGFHKFFREKKLK